MTIEPNKNRLIVVISMFLIVGFLLTILISFFVSRHSLRSQIVSNTLPLTSDNIYSEIQRDLLRPIFISSLMASDTFVRDWILQGEGDSDDLVRYLTEIKEKYGVFTAFLVSDKSNIYYHTEGLLKKVSPDDPRDEWYFRIKNFKEPYEINVDLDMANNDAMTVFVNYQMLDYAGEYIGATGVGLAVDVVKNLIQAYEERYDRIIYFVDKEGNVKLSGDRFPDSLDNVFDIETIAKEKDGLFADKGQQLTFKRDGTTIHLATRYIAEFDWYLFVEESERDTLKQVFYTLFINLVICGIVIAIVLTVINMTITAYQARLEKLAVTDKLTSAYNRRAFDLLMAQAVKEVKRDGKDLSLILFDIDWFKKVNDSYGHLAGDKVIQDVVNLTRQTLRESDVICRWGGEEFLIILRECNLENGTRMAENIRQKVGAHITTFQKNDIKVTISLGVAQYTGDDTEDSLLSRADKSLYLAKNNGRNRVERA